MKSNSPSPVPSTPLIERLRKSGRVDEFIRKANTRAEVHTKQRKRVRNASFGTLALAVLLAWAIPYYQDTTTYATLSAKRSTVVFSDGSEAELNANTKLFADFRYGRRTITLEHGEAFFSVTTDPAHPFLVKTSSGTVRVTGTKFNVRSTDRAAEVTLLDGKVTFEADTGVTAMSPGQQLDSVTGVRTLSDQELTNFTAWRKGRIALRGLTLAQAVERLAAYHGYEITCDPAVANLLPGGSFALEDIKGFIEGIETVLPVRVIDRGNNRYSVLPR